MPKLAANLSMMFTEVPFLDRFRAASNCGFRGVEFLFPYDLKAGDIAGRLHENGLKQVLFNLPPGNWAAGERGLTSLPGREAEFREGVDLALDYAASLRCQQIHTVAGLIAEDAGAADHARAGETYVENLKWAAARAAEHGVRLLIEPINTRDVPGFFLTSMRQARDVLAAVDSNNLFLQVDIYHQQIIGGDLARTLRANFDVTRHIQIAGNPGRHEPDQGEINYPYLFNLIDSLNYQGWIGCEYRPAGATVDGLGWAFEYGISGHGGG